MVNEEAIEQAINDLRSQELPNFTAASEKYNVHRTTLTRRFKGEALSYTEARSRSHKLLTNAEESVLLEYI